MSPHHLLILLLHEGVDDTGMDLGHSPSPGHPEGGISGQSGILERILLSCLKGLLSSDWNQLEPVDVDFGPPWGCR